MRAEQVLAVLMDDKKYKARVDELKAAEAKLSAVRQIADTLEQLRRLVQRLKPNGKRPVNTRRSSA
jgi:hypothetical protein